MPRHCTNRRDAAATDAAARGRRAPACRQRRGDCTIQLACLCARKRHSALRCGVPQLHAGGGERRAQVRHLLRRGVTITHKLAQLRLQRIALLRQRAQLCLRRGQPGLQRVGGTEGGRVGRQQVGGMEESGREQGGGKSG
eukprot:355524-Chlamydomonas_euryale.AAC.51